MNYLFGITDTGKIRDNNEDVFIAAEVMNGQFMIAGVIDGVGGYEGGEFAAALTKEVVLSELNAIGADILTQLEIAFNLANEEIFARKLQDSKLSAMACVATVAVIDRLNNQLHYIHVGDTRLYLFRDNTLIKLSSDQSPVGFLEDSGRITEEAAMQHPQRNVINQALGLSNQEEMSENYFETGSSPFLPGDLVLVCSDGLTDMINREVISKVLAGTGSLKVRAEKLIAAANAAGGNDNITVVLAKNDKAPVAHPVSRPAADLFSQSNTEKPVVKTIPEPVIPVAAAENFSGFTEPAKSPAKTVEPQTNKPLIMILSVLCAVLLISTAWLFITNPPVKLKSSGTLTTVPAIAVNPQEKMLSDTLAKLKGDTLVLSADLFKTPIRLSRALTINKDSLVIKTKGDITFQPDSAYAGPALILSASCKYIVIDQLVFDHFETGIVSHKNVLDLKNVKFNNCKVPLQVLFEFPDHSFVNGRVSKRAFQADSVAKK
ncbi:serine/threonine-protein phosphatase [Pedobacter sp. MC2016-15]|uniref:PP2C family protein-serine/threonine phosphatase n=1 Tax=Pedobacter sp. MC2016-15 TaxID=2994473 RepID=UPI00224531E7|nr:PP2C family serine/threonine-protein phosphatase [Pedobacter sp. MC2016-15]MCX2477923.1 serine/threonine-protein phosphatase [Pedobacter sp. MC2016-15]